MWILLVILGVLVGAAAAVGLYLWLAMRWLMAETGGDRYFGRTLPERRALREEIRRRSPPVLRLTSIAAKLGARRIPESELRGVRVPAIACPRSALQRAADYRPTAEDVFVATQMKCGTTWLQQVAYEVLLRVEGNLGDDGHRHMYALSPWIEANSSVSMDDAPLVEGRRIVKTHLPVSLCPYSESARYLYVTRHPVACLASCIDFVRMLTGPMTPTTDEFVDWFCSDRMWWRSWPEHVEGWWQWAQERPNVLFFHYEDMLEDLPGAVGQVSDFFETPLTPEQLSTVVHKSGYDYMKANEEVFEMAPPSFFSLGEGSFFRSGKGDRDRDVGEADRERVLAFCRERLQASAYPVERFYPDVASAS